MEVTEIEAGIGDYIGGTQKWQMAPNIRTSVRVSFGIRITILIDLSLQS